MSRDGQKGAAVVEFAVVFFLLLVLLFGILEFGFLWAQSHYIANAAREGGRVAARLENPTSAAGRQSVENAVKSYLKGMYSDERVESDCCGTGDFISVAVAEDTLAALDTTTPSVDVTVTVQTAQFWDPVLWGLLALLPGPDPEEIREISESAVFASQGNN